MKVKLALILFAILVVGAITAFILNRNNLTTSGAQEVSINTDSLSTNPNAPDSPQTIHARNLKIPWQVLFLPDSKILITERPGVIKVLDNQNLTTIEVQGVKHVGEGGLLGAALHPDFAVNNFIYLYYTTEQNGQLSNRVNRYTLVDNELTDESVIIENIRGSSNHDGGRLAFGPDGYLYVTSGDAGNPDSAQDTNSLNGKILRVRDDGSIPDDNPFGNAVYSYGHRNPQGITWDESGRLWSTEHGPSGAETGWDELNIIEKGMNYGWPVIKGDAQQENMLAPIIHSGSDETWAPASATFYNGRILFGGLRGQALFEYNIESKKLIQHFKNEFGRIRDVQIGPDDKIYLTTSNTDGRGRALKDHDLLISVTLAIPKTAEQVSVKLPDLPNYANLDLPQHYYQTFNNCGPATLSMTLNYYGLPTTQLELGRVLRPFQNPQGDNDDKSVSLSEMSAEAENRGFNSYFKANGDINKLKHFTSNGIPVIVTTWLNPKEDVGHYRIVTGYNEAEGVVLQDDSYQGPNKKYTYSEFLSLWQPFNYQYLIIVNQDKKILAESIIGDEMDFDTNWTNALTRAGQESKQNTQNPYPIFNQATSAYYLGDFAKTVELYESIASKLPGRMLWYQLEPIEAYIKLEEYTKALSIINRILNNDNKAYSELYIMRGDIYLQQGNKAAAKSEYDLALLYNINLPLAKERIASIN